MENPSPNALCSSLSCRSGGAARGGQGEIIVNSAPRPQAEASDESSSPRETARGRLSALRVAGYLLYNAWLLATFYNTFLYGATADFRWALYNNTLLSLIVLALTLLLYPRLVEHGDKRVLSRRASLGSGIAMALSTSMLVFADGSTVSGIVLIVASGIGTGISSGILFLGWCRLYADAGTRVALIEAGAAWSLAAALCFALSLIPALLASTVVIVGACASGVILRRCAFSRPRRPQPIHNHRLLRRTRLMFARGLVACLCVGLVAGFSDVLAGYRLITVPERYELFLLVSCALVALAMLAVAMLSRHDFMTHAYRLVTLLLVVGCLLTSLIHQTNTLSNIVIFGAYISFTMLLCVVCIDVSNYFDQPATRTFGMAFACLYLGEIAGNALSHLLTGAVGQSGSLDLGPVSIALTIIVVFANLFLFTEKDLTETSLGEMVDDDSDEGDGDVGPAVAGRLASHGSPCARVAGGLATCDAFGGEGSAGCDGCQHAQAGEGGAEAGVCALQATVSLEELAAAQQANLEAITSSLAERFGLTPRETEVLPLIIRGRTIARIQEELHISQGTVGTHARHIYQKTGVRNRQGLLDLIDQLNSEEEGDREGRGNG